MKIATAHRLNGSEVVFVRGTDKVLRDQHWDEVFITSLFTFRWKPLIETIRFYTAGPTPPLVGGVAASLLPEDIRKETGVSPHVGPLTNCVPWLPKVAKADRDLGCLAAEIAARGIDALPPDYGVFEDVEVPYHSVLRDNYILRSSRGCSRHCDFCGVRILEPTFVPSIPLEPLVSYIDRRWGKKRNLILLDDNVLQSRDFDRAIDEIIALGFRRGDKLDNKLRSVDFNQGLDLRLIQKKHLARLAELEVRPLRIAFDNVALEPIYLRKIPWVLDHGFREISTYVLYNHNDTPADLYRRLNATCRINEQLDARVYSFPMKYIPCTAKDRHHLGAHWTRRQIRGIQCILNASYGIAPTQPAYLRRAFGSNVQEFLRIIQMPENYIIQRREHHADGSIVAWQRAYEKMSCDERRAAKRLIAKGKGLVPRTSPNRRIQEFLRHYRREDQFRERK